MGGETTTGTIRTSARARQRSARPADQRTVRRMNLALVIQCIAREGGTTSRARISTETGLNPSTVSSLTAELIERGMLREAGVAQTGSIGRPGRSLELDPEGGAAIGAEIGDEGIGLVATDLAGRVRYRAFLSQSNRDKDPAEVVRQIADLVNEALSQFVGRPPATCTMALPGLIDGAGVLLEGPNIGWHGVPIVELWSEASAGHLPLALENEARLAAYAEMTQGAARDLRSFAYISGGIGIGSGIVLDRQIFRGAHGFAGEFGHLSFDAAAPGSAGTIQALAGQASFMDLTAERPRRDDPDWLGREMARRAAREDAATLDAIAAAGRVLGVGLSNLANLFDMEAFVLGGFLSHIGEWLREPIRRELEARVIAQRWKPTAVLFSTVGREAAVRGAARRSLDAILEHYCDPVDAA